MIKLTTTQKLFITAICFAFAIVGFLVKLPSVFHHSDKGLHAAFYFLAAGLLNVFFGGKHLIRHLLIGLVLYIFGWGIEYAQSYSNRLFHNRIHGRVDPEDVSANLSGLIAFSLVWIVCVIGWQIYNKAKGNSPMVKRNAS